jgi:AsmA protein
MLKKIGKIAKYTGIVFSIALFMVILAPYILPNTVSQKIKQLANESLTTELNFSKARLSFIRHFPKLTLSLYDVDLKGSSPFENQSLLTAKEIALGIDLTSIFSNSIKVDEIFVDKGVFSIQTDSLGYANYNIYKSASVKEKQPKDSTTASLKIEKIVIESSQLTYNDASLPMLVKANGLNYTGKGDLSKAIFDPLILSTLVITNNRIFNRNSYQPI